MAAVERELAIRDAETRKASLEKRARALEADLNALMGAIQDCEFWISWFKGEIESPSKDEEMPGLELPDGVQIVGVEEIPETAAAEAEDR